MLKNISWEEARDQLLARVHPVSTENVSLYACAGRILAFPLVAQEDVPAFDRSAYDGYALKSADVAEASPASPVTLSITETVPAGTVPSLPVCHGTAAHVMTGAGIPEGADCVIASRYCEKSKIVGIPAFRELLSDGAKLYYMLG